jgi:hypothetical protein
MVFLLSSSDGFKKIPITGFSLSDGDFCVKFEEREEASGKQG